MIDFDKLKISEVPVDYDSPINMIVQQVAQDMSDRMAKLDNEVGDLLVGTAIKLGFDVDREKLIAVLTQDRERYVHAYRQGYEKRDDEIVRCRDCRLKKTFDCPCECMDSYYSWTPKDDWFCANGVKKDD